MTSDTYLPFATLLSIEYRGKKGKKDRNAQWLTQQWARNTDEAVGKAIAEWRVQERDKKAVLVNAAALLILPQDSDTTAHWEHPAFTPNVSELIREEASHGAGLFLSAHQVTCANQEIVKLKRGLEAAQNDAQEQRDKSTRLASRVADLLNERDASKAADARIMELEQACDELAVEVASKASELKQLNLQRKNDYVAIGDKIVELVGSDEKTILDALGLEDIAQLGMMGRIIDLSVGLIQAIDFLNVLYGRVEVVNSKYPEEHKVTLTDIPNWKGHLERVLAVGIDYPVTRNMQNAMQGLPAGITAQDSTSQKMHWATEQLKAAIDILNTDANNRGPSALLAEANTKLKDAVSVFSWVKIYQCYWG